MQRTPSYASSHGRHAPRAGTRLPRARFARGIAHSERSSPEVRARGHAYHGIQAWVALPREEEDCVASFSHHPASTLPHFDADGVEVRVIAGEAFGGRSPVPTSSATLYVE